MIERFIAALRGMRVRRDEEGQALIELALVSPLLFLILLGAVEFATVTYDSIEVSNAARAGVQYAAMNGGNTGDTTGITNAIQNDSYNLGTRVSLSPNYPQTTFACSDGSTYSTTTYCGNATIFETVSVKTQITVNPLVGWIGLPTSFTLVGYAQEMVLQ